MPRSLALVVALVLWPQAAIERVSAPAGSVMLGESSCCIRHKPGGIS